MSVSKKLTVSASPHVRSSQTAAGIMLDVIIALIPSLIAATVIFGYRVLMITIVSVSSAVLSEYLCRKVMKRHNTIGDLSAVVTGLLLAFNLPATTPLWMASIGSVVAIVVVKQMFGGIGQNFVNPALVGRIVLMSSFPTQMATWTAKPIIKAIDVSTGASPLSELKTMFSGEIAQGGAVSVPADMPKLWQMFLGLRLGSVGEVCAAALILGGLYLVIRRVISPAIPLTYIGTVALIMLIAGRGSFTFVGYHLLSGGLMLGAIFMATDYSTTPINFKGKLIFGVGCGLLTALIRLFGSLPEGVSFSIIIMNILVPHIERLTTPKPFGTPKKEKKEAEAK